MNNSNHLKSGFTLIELLIVVAIIAILAAIAVPNFLEAQVRSKVSRVKADMRSLNVACESYMVDNNAYPLDWDYYQYKYLNQIPGNGTGRDDVGTQVRLTTPIAYISSVIYDVFQSDRGKDRNGDNYNPWGQRGVFHYSGTPWFKDADLLNTRGLGYAWISMGPNKIWDFSLETPYWTSSINNAAMWEGPQILYDPSNGTTSYGDIRATNKGMHVVTSPIIAQ
jgi:prepilin-type N-terminal cleavage/methylation domain-containing protein